MGKPALDRNYQWLLNGRPTTSPDCLVALAMDARRRDISYGQLVANTSGFERFQIVEAYKRARKRRSSRRKENRPG